MIGRRLLVCSLLVPIPLLLASSTRAGIEAGAATRVITPDPLLPVSGGMGPTAPAHEKRGELTARAMVLRKGSTSVAIVALDLLGFLGPWVIASGPGSPGSGRRTS